ncbi:Conserved_hypothetical protein [Hexamita inflata]|uniref:C_GCAxxG_C_C family protein n=1 Tax=Hexamita inflata TaxID=28002 RepID=A0AA86NU96_9EUKA|nr:Conserved hypothetical protein [Hexamita inflata]CAI9966752.1 Conserved hypothetical protein [Hexamita inflata]
MTSPQNPEIFRAGPKYASGNAPKGMCGAVYAAIKLKPEFKKEIIENFEKVTGGLTCKQLKGGKTSCSDLVDMAISLVKK